MNKPQRRTATYTCQQIFAMAWLAALIMLSLGTTPAHAQVWPTKKFAITNTDPDAWINLPDWVPGTGFTNKQKNVIRDFEKYLGEVATYYESMGFRAPTLPMTKNSDGDSAYVVYIYDFPAGQTAALAGYSPDGTVSLRVDLSRAIINGKPSERAYEDLAHELFHNVQRAYQSAYELDHENWIAEGQAQAVGVDTAYKLRGVMRFKTDKQDYRLGGRPYYTPLAKANASEAYRTSSFWRYIGEHYAAGKTNRHAGVNPIAADYGYLAKVFGHPFKGSSSTAADLRWLDRALKKELGLGLNRLYANFITTFAEYVPARLHKMSSTPEKAAASWRKYIFDGCEVVMPMSSLSPTGRAEFNIDRNAAGCFLVNAQGLLSTDVEIDIAITARSGSPQALKALHIGTDGGQKVGLPRIVGMSKGGGGGYLGHWRFRIRTGQNQVFVISNVAEDAEKSTPQKVVLDLTISTWGSSMTKPVPQKAPTKKTPKVKSANKTEVGAKLEEALADLDFLTATSALGTEVRMEAYNPGCREPFRFKPCGPALSIGLSLTPGSLLASDMHITGSKGSWVGQIRNMTTNKAVIAKGYEEYADRMPKMEGAYVSIQIPNISYGFTGSFDNALISVSGHNDTRYVSIGPQNVLPGAMHPHYPLSGHVSIEEFTPVVLRGRFEAQLVDMDRVKPGTQTLPIHKTISGQFVITAPWTGDPNIKRMVPSEESSLQNLTEAFPFAFGGGLEELARRHNVPFPRGGPARQSGGKSGGSAAAETFHRVESCECTCQPLESYSSYCRPICTVKVQSCEVRELQLTADRQALSNANIRDRRNQAREAKLASLNDADKRDYVAYLFILGIAQMTHGVSGSTNKAEEMTRSEFQAYLKNAGTDESDMQKMLDFFEQEHAAGTP